MSRVQVLLTLILAALASSARAQSPDVWQTYSQLLAGNPSAASALQADPSLYRSSAFMNQTRDFSPTSSSILISIVL